MHKALWSRLLAVAVILSFCSISSAQFGRKHGQVKQAAVNYTAMRAGQPGVAAVVVEIAEGFHAQSHEPLDPNFIKFEIRPEANDNVIFGEPQYPPGKIENYPALGKLSVYTGQFTVYVPVKVKADAKLGPIEITGKLRLQACDEKACYPPESPKFSIKTEIVAADAAVKPNEPELFKGYHATRESRGPQASAETTPPPAVVAETPSAASIFGIELGKNAYGFVFAVAFLIGIIFNAMPCVLPVIPLKALGFYQVAQHNRAKSLLLGSVFSIGMIATFAMFGFLIFVRHAFDWGGLFTHTWFIALIVILLLVLSASTFGLFTVALPTAIYRVTPREDTYWGNFLFGVFTALLSTPCTFGMFVAVLAWALLQPPAIGVLVLATVGAGMAFPYLLLSALPELARRFPRTGPWGEVVKQMMGFVLLIVAVYFARPFIERFNRSETFFWGLLFALVNAAAAFLVIRAVQLSPNLAPRLWAGAVALVIVASAGYAMRWLVYQPYQWTPFSQANIDTAKQNNQIALVEFTAAWCANCQYLEKTVLHSAPIVQQVHQKGIVMLKADVTTDDAPARPLLRELNPAGSIPLTVIFPPNGKQPIELRGIYSAADLQHALDLAARSNATALASR